MKVPIVPARGRLLGIRDAATYLGVGENKVVRLIRRGELVVLRHTSGRLEGIFERDLDLWIEQHRRVPQTTARTPGQIAVDERIRQLMPAVRRFGVALPFMPVGQPDVPLDVLSGVVALLLLALLLVVAILAKMRHRREVRQWHREHDVMADRLCQSEIARLDYHEYLATLDRAQLERLAVGRKTGGGLDAA